MPCPGALKRSGSSMRCAVNSPIACCSLSKATGMPNKVWTRRKPSRWPPRSPKLKNLRLVWPRNRCPSHHRSLRRLPNLRNHHCPRFPQWKHCVSNRWKPNWRLQRPNWPPIGSRTPRFSAPCCWHAGGSLLRVKTGCVAWRAVPERRISELFFPLANVTRPSLFETHGHAQSVQGLA
jgi:hypothetical protein